MSNLYEKCVEAGVPVEGRFGDMYIPVNPTTAELVKVHLKDGGTKPEIFTSQIDGKLWYDVPFAFKPFWEAKAAESKRREELK